MGFSSMTSKRLDDRAEILGVSVERRCTEHVSYLCFGAKSDVANWC